MTKKLFDKLFSPDNLWICLEGAVAYIGITNELAADAGDINSTEIEKSKRILKSSDYFASIEGRRKVIVLKMPLEGKILEVNDKVIKNPGLLNNSQQESIWVIKIAIISPPETENLLTEKEYSKFLSQQKQSV